MRKKVLIIHKGCFDKFPPLLSVKKSFNSFGYNVDVITKKCEDKSFFLPEERCEEVVLPNMPILVRHIVWYIRFLYMLVKHQKKKEYEFIWIEGGDTMALFGVMLDKRKTLYYQQSELYDKKVFYKFLIGLFIKKATKIIVPEKNRAYILKVWYNLDKLPYVLPNKPNYNICETNVVSSLNKIKNKVKDYARNRRIILYQGWIAPDRKFDGVVEFIESNPNDYCLVLLGGDLGYLNQIRKLSSNFLYLGFLPPPSHLEITKLSWICLMAYDTTSLNKVYCAPNKIWEYSKYKKPILSQNLPGIDWVFTKYSFGECCDLMCSNSVKMGLEKISNNYDSYQCSAESFYNSLNFDDEVRNIIRK